MRKSLLSVLIASIILSSNKSDDGYDMFMAMGMGGQFIINFPDLHLIVVTTTNKDISWDNDHEIPTLEIVSDFILKAL